MKRAYAVFIAFMILNLGLCATLLATKPPSLKEAFQLQFVTLLLNICGAVLFLLAIKGFRQSVKIAYRFMSAGALMLLAGVVEIYALQALGIKDQPWALEIPFLMMAVFFYIGISTFATLIWAQTRLAKAKLVFGAAVILGLLAGFGPSLLLGLGSGYDALTALRFCTLTLFTSSLILAYAVWVKTSPLYRRAFTWLVAFFSLTVFNTLCGFLQEASWMGWFGQASIILYLVAGILLSITALQFNRVAYAENDKSRSVKTGVGRSVDIIIFVATFASSREAIDPILDRLRELTATKTTPNWLPGEAEQAQLAGIYLSLEEYLVNKEPLRKFEQTALRQMIELQFKDAVNEPFFWQNVPVETTHS